MSHTIIEDKVYIGGRKEVAWGQIWCRAGPECHLPLQGQLLGLKASISVWHTDHAQSTAALSIMYLHQALRKLGQQGEVYVLQLFLTQARATLASLHIFFLSTSFTYILFPVKYCVCGFICTHSQLKTISSLLKQRHKGQRGKCVGH